MSSNDQMSEFQCTPRRSSPLLVHAICGVMALAGSMGTLAQSDDNQQETEELASLMQRLTA